MVTGLVSGAATSGVLANAQAEATKLKGLKPQETTSAQTSATNINSIFEEAKKAVEEAKANGTSISDTAVSDINNKSNEILTTSEENKQKIADIIADSTNVIAEYTQQLTELNEQKKSIEEQIIEAGGTVEQEDSSPASESEQPQPTLVDAEGNVIEQPQNNNKESKSVQNKGGEADNAKIADLQSQLESVNGQIADVNTDMATSLAENSAQTAAVVTENSTMVASGQQEISGIKTKADGELNQETSKLNQKSTQANQSLAKEITQQTASQTKNTANSTSAAATAKTAKAAADAAASDDPNKASLEQVAQELEGLSKDFGMESGIAKTNSENKTNAGKYQQEIQSAVSSAVSGDFTQFSQKLNEAFTTAMQQTSSANNIMQGQDNQTETPTANNSQGNTTTSPISSNKTQSSNNDNGKMAMGIASAVTGTLSDIFGGGSGGDSDNIITKTLNGVMSGISSSYS